MIYDNTLSKWLVKANVSKIKESEAMKDFFKDMKELGDEWFTKISRNSQSLVIANKLSSLYENVTLSSFVSNGSSTAIKEPIKEPLKIAGAIEDIVGYNN